MSYVAASAGRNALLARYWATFVYAWRRRHDGVASLLTPEEAAFSPPALALEQRPVSPTIRATAGLLMGLVLVCLCWAVIGKVDIVANAKGKVVPSGRTKTIASVQTAVVRAIHVSEGQVVKTGDVLIELDASTFVADHNKATAEQRAAQLQIARSRALIDAISSRHSPRLPAVPGVSASEFLEAQTQLTGQYLDFVARLTQLDSDIERYSQTLPVALERERIYKALLENQDVAREAWLEKEQDRIDLQGRLTDARNARSVLIAQTERATYEALTDASKTLASSTQDAARAASQASWLTLRAPVNGTVQQMTVHTIGGVAQAAQPIMSVVPTEKRVEIEAFLENKEIGFIEVGQSAQVKVAAFDYTRYGTLAGKVASVSHDAIEDKERGLLYSVKVLLDQPTLEVQGRVVTLMPGMAVSVEIKTGSRRIIEYILSPVLRHERESLHER
jgi:hemolysin D